MIGKFYGAFGAAVGITEGVLRAFLYPTRSGAGAAKVEATVNGHDQSSPLQACTQQLHLQAEPHLIALVPLLVVGDSGVGKTSFVLHYLDGLWPPAPGPTVGADLYTLRLVAHQQLTVLQIWDVGNDQSAGFLDDQIYKNAAGAVIVCKLDSADCIEKLDHWQNRLHQVSPDLPLVVVAAVHSQTDNGQPLKHNGEQVQQDVIMWCNSKHVHVYFKVGWQDHQTLTAAFDDLTLAALSYIRKRPDPKRKSFSSQRYPELFKLLNGDN